MTAEGGTGQLEAGSPGRVLVPRAVDVRTVSHTPTNPNMYTDNNEKKKNNWKERRQQTRDAATTSSTLFYQHLCLTQPWNKNFLVVAFLCCCWLVVLFSSSFFFFFSSRMHHTDDAQSIQEDDPCTLSCSVIYFHFYFIFLFFFFDLPWIFLFGGHSCVRFVQITARPHTHLSQLPWPMSNLTPRRRDKNITNNKWESLKL